jgi:cytochrome P450
MIQTANPLPVAESETGLHVLKALARQRSLLPALEIMHADVGDIFQITLPSFKPVVLVGPTFNRLVLVTDRDNFLWRSEKDPVTHLLRHGLLVEDGRSHDQLRAVMEPELHRRKVYGHVEAMGRFTDIILAQWEDGMNVDMLVEMRRIALLILMGTLFGVDFMPEMERLWKPILRAIKYISPGFWIIWPDLPRPGYRRALQELDGYLFDLISRRRAAATESQDLLGHLIASGMSDDLIRDQVLTMLIAGHDTSTALLAWALYLLGRHPNQMAQAQTEIDSVLGQQTPSIEHVGQLRYLDQVIKETLRLYPPIHVGNRISAKSQQLQGYQISKNMRVMYSIYLSHRDEAYWPDPQRFAPERFDRSEGGIISSLSYVPFGGGPRNCIGAAFAQVEAKVVLARILQMFDLLLLPQKVSPYMGATLEPRPGVMMRVSHRKATNG